MTHLSDFSFLRNVIKRAVGLSYVFIWFIYRIHTTSGFQCLQLSRVKRGELKSIVTITVMFMLPFQLYYDIVSSKIKYQEGFLRLPNGKIITKPEVLWDQADRNLVIPTDYSLCIGLSLQSGTLLLLQCFWNYLAKLVAKARFMSSKEFKFYILMTLINIVLFPILQYNFSRDIYEYTYKEIMPQLVYGCELLLVSFLGGVSHFRFKNLLSNSKNRNNAQFITQKIRYFQDLNLILSVSLLIFSLCFIVMSADGLSSVKRISQHKFPSDFFICNINIMSNVIWVIVILIFHPKNTIDEDVGYKSNNSNSNNNNNASNSRSTEVSSSLPITLTSNITIEDEEVGAYNKICKPVM